MEAGELLGRNSAKAARNDEHTVINRVCRLVVVALVLLTMASTAAPAAASARPTSENASATHAYLIASNTFEEAELRNLPQSNAAMEATALRISGECPGVLAGAPPAEQELDFTSLQAQTPVSPRAEGERRRQSTQREDLQFELSTALEDARSQLNREATEALISALTPLRWSSPTMTVLVHVTLASAKADLALPVPSVCADIEEWVASGFKTLSPASKDIASYNEALLKDGFELIAIVGQVHLKSFTEFLAPLENASDRALARRNQTLTAELHSSSVSKQKTLKDLEATVGLPAPKPQKKLLPSIKEPPVIARGKTAAGGKFVVRAEGRSKRPDAVGCSAFITIEEPSRPQEGVVELLSSGEGTSRCVSRSHVDPQPAVHCNSGLLTLEASLLPATRSVRLLMSNERTITSPAIRVPARQGGPAGLYYQVVRGPSPIPVSLTELDAQGNTLTVLKLPAVVECTKNPIKYAPGGIVRLIHESLPQGPSFTIRAERFRKLGATHFELKAEVSEQRLFSAGDEIGSLFGTESESEPGPPPGVPGHAIRLGGLGEGGTFAPHTSDGCEPQPYAIVYGLLKAPRDTVLARVSGKLVPLRKVAIPARLHADGVLAYGAFSPLPSELLVRSPAGKIIASEDRSGAAKADTETCEGEAES
ncbi:MAG: hypothetical protein ABSB69_18320 [Solirubrobacteraceae bacterium]